MSMENRSVCSLEKCLKNKISVECSKGPRRLNGRQYVRLNGIQYTTHMITKSGLFENRITRA